MIKLKNIVNESTPTQVIKDLDKAKKDLLKKVNVLIDKKKKLYSDVDIESPMSADEKKLDKDIADLFSQIFKLIRQKRSVKKESVNEGKVHFEKKLKSGNIFQVIDRDTKGMRGTQDKFSMQIVDKKGKVVKHIGSHPSLSGAKKFSNSVNEGKIPQPIQNLIDNMVKNKIQRKTVKIKSKSGHSRFMKDVKPAVKDKLLIIRHNPIDNDEMWISLGSKAQDMIESVNEGKITKTFKFPRKTSTDIDEIDADFSRQGIQSNPDFNNNTVTVTGDENKIKKIVKFHRGVEESVNERYRPNLESKGWEAAQKVIRQLQSSVFRKLDDDELLEFRKAIANAFNLDGILKEQADHVSPMVVKAYKEYLQAKKDGSGEKEYRYYSKKLNNTYSTRADRDAIEAILKKKYGRY